MATSKSQSDNPGRDATDGHDQPGSKSHEDDSQERSGRQGATGEVWELASELDLLSRPLALVRDASYAVTWLRVRLTIDGDRGRLMRLPFVLRYETGDLRLFGPPIDGARPMDELDLALDLPFEPIKSLLWIESGMKQALDGYRANSSDVFRRIREAVDRFVDFSGSLGDHMEMCSLIAVSIFATYLTDAYTVVGNIWATGDYGTGKTSLLALMAKLSYLGQLILPGGTYPTLRDAAHYGATLCFDDAEHVADKDYDADKKSLVLAGNRKGVYVTAKEALDGGGWRTRYYSAYCPRFFSAMRLPDKTLASRTVIVPLVRTDDSDRSDLDPQDDDEWPYPPQELRDSLWNVGLFQQRRARELFRRIGSTGSVTGRALQPWRWLLATAKLIEEAGEEGVYDVILDLAERYQDERQDLESPDRTVVVIKALGQVLGPAEAVEVTASDIATQANIIAWDEGLAGYGEEYITAKECGGILNQVRVPKGERQSSQRPRIVRREQVDRLKRAYRIAEDGGGERQVHDDK